MKILLITREGVRKFKLSENNRFWITNTIDNVERNLIEIQKNDNNITIESNEYVKLIDYRYVKMYNNELKENLTTNMFVEESILKKNEICVFYNGFSESLEVLYYTKENSNSFFHFKIADTDKIFIGTEENNDIIYSSEFISDIHAKIRKHKGAWYIENYDKDNDYGVFVNSIPIYNNAKKIFNGDIIFIMGLKIIFINDTIFINNPNNKVKLNDKFRLIRKRCQIIKDNNIDNILEDEEKVDYFSKGPRLKKTIGTKKIKMDAPPQLQDEKDKPILLTIGSSLAMGAVTIVSLISTIQGRVSGTATTFDTVLSAITTLAMLIGTLLIPILSVKYDEKSTKKYLEKRQKRYIDYLTQKENQINKLKEEYRKYLFFNYLSSAECAKIISLKNDRLWERDKNDVDFLTIRLGVGETNSNIEVVCPEEGFSMEDDELLDELHELADRVSILDDSPVTLSLRKHNISAIISKDSSFLNKYMKNIIVQLIALHSYADLKLVFMLSNKDSYSWEYVKMLPHIWDNNKEIRFFANNSDDINELAKYLKEQLEKSISQNQENKKNKDNELPYYLIITNDYRSIQNVEFIKKLCNLDDNVDFSLLCIADELNKAPKQCKSFVKVNSEHGILFEDVSSSQNKKKFNVDTLNIFYFENINKILSNIQIKTQIKDTFSLPENYTFLEMYNVGNIEQLNIYNRWKKNDSTLSLKAPIGIDSTGKIVYLDAHEKYHGPHGIIAGSTGSGKSEFIITYILSLAINYHPDDVNLLLIDYKGGGLSGAFQRNGIKLPHLAGTITNIDRSGLQRAFVSIQSELRRRQVLFNEARDITDEGTIDIYKYQKLYHNGIVKKPIPHLFIICDEFAELKQQQEDFMDELISVSRIGRSLGVHLILATQKPAGIVNDQIRSNSKFAICLKVQDISDSQDILNKSDAAYLRKPGQFYMQVGNDEYYVLGQSGWAGATYIPDKMPRKKVDNSLEVISNVGSPIKRIDSIVKQKINNQGEQLTNIVKAISNIAKENNIKVSQLWLEDLPADIYLSDLRNKYSDDINNEDMEVVIGEYDDPSNQKQGIEKIDLLKKENLLIYGNAESGKETLLSSFIYDAITTYSSNNVQFYILDFGSEALKIYKNAPHVSDVVLINEEEKIESFFEVIEKEIKTRKNLLSNYNGEYTNYIAAGNTLPIKLVVVNNYEAFEENYSYKYDDVFLTLTRDGSKCGILFVLTASTAGSVKYRLTQNFSKKITLQLSNEDEYNLILDNVGKLRPAHIFGRGITIIDKKPYEFQTARICDNINYNEQIEETINLLNQIGMPVADRIPVLPDVLQLQDVRKELKGIEKVPLGMFKKNLKICTYDFRENFMTILISNDMNDIIEYASYIEEEVENLKDTIVKTFDAEKIRIEKKQSISEVLLKELTSDLKKKDEDNKFVLYIIIGMEKFVTDETFNETEFLDILKEEKETGQYSFLIVDNAGRIGDHQFDEWYKNYIHPNSGIWVGKGIESQMIFSLGFGSPIDNKCDRTFGYIITEGEAMSIKLIGMSEAEDET